MSVKTLATGLLSGIIFGLGLAVSQMSNPSKVLNFLNVSGSWDPSLALVMLGALLVLAPGYRYLHKHYSQCVMAKATNQQKIQPRLFFGAAIFGLGWGIAGYCPGPAFTALKQLPTEAIWFLPALFLGFWMAELLKNNKP